MAAWRDHPKSDLWRRLWRAICAALCLFVPIAAAEMTTVKYFDGDTIQTNDGRWRLYGIDAPEIDQPYGYDSAVALSDAINDRKIHIWEIGTDKYGRLIGLIEYRDYGTTVQARMISEGAAWVYPQYCKRPECESWKRLERMARESKRGLWADDDPVAPWDWRKYK